jgi:hypothetical protein
MRRTIRSLLVLFVVWVCAYAGMVVSGTAATAGDAASVGSKCSTTTCSATLRCCAPYACHRGRCLID